MKKLRYLNLKNLAYYFLVMSLVLTGISSVPVMSQYDPWIQKAGMDKGRHSFTTSMVDDKIYIIGGSGTDRLFTVYDLATNTWTTKDTLPTKRMVHSSSVVNGKVYALGGLVEAYVPAIATVEEYDPATDTWTTKTPMPTTRCGLGTAVVDGKIYAIGGMTSGPTFWSGMHKTVEVYDPLTDSWSTKKDMPTPRLWFSTSVVDGKIYAIGGALVTKEPISTVEVYDPKTNTWTTKTPMPTARMVHAAAVIDGIIYVIGGGTVSEAPGGFSVVEAYNPVTDTWTRMADIPEKRASLCTYTDSGKIYALGGIRTWFDPNLIGTKTVYEYNPAADLSGLVNSFSINKCYAEVGTDSICFTTKINDPAGVSLFAMIESPDQTFIDSIQLFDDGNHNDEDAEDSIYSNIWHTSSSEEKYYVDLKVKQENVETIIHRMNNIALFTTIGPVVFESYTYISADTIPNPGDQLQIKLTLKNNSSTVTAQNIQARLTSLDTMVSVSSSARNFGNIIAGESSTTHFLNYFIDISEECPDTTKIPIMVDITSDGYKFWSDTFSIFVVRSATNINTKENLLQQFSNYPNPFKTSTTIQFDLSRSGFISLKVYDYLGKELTTLVSELVDAGNHSVIFDASNFSSGIYFYSLETGDMVLTRKMLLMK